MKDLNDFFEYLGLIPSSEMSWDVAVNALKLKTGGFLHIHTNLDVNKDRKKIDKYKEEWIIWSQTTRDKIKDLLDARCHTLKWSVLVQHIEYVKSYAPRVDHIVLDLECRPIKNDL